MMALAALRGGPHHGRVMRVPMPPPREIHFPVMPKVEAVWVPPDDDMSEVLGVQVKVGVYEKAGRFRAQLWGRDLSGRQYLYRYKKG